MSSEWDGKRGGRRRRGSSLGDANATAAASAGPRSSPVEWAAAIDADEILAAARHVLREAGVAVVLPAGLRDRAVAAGLEVAGDRIRFPDGAAEALLATAPSRFTHRSRSGEHDLEIGGGRVLLGPPLAARWMWSGRKERFALTPDHVREVCDVAAALGLAYDGCGLAATHLIDHAASGSDLRSAIGLAPGIALHLPLLANRS